MGDLEPKTIEQVAVPVEVALAVAVQVAVAAVVVVVVATEAAEDLEVTFKREKMSVWH